MNRYMCGFDEFANATDAALEWAVTGASNSIVMGRTGNAFRFANGAHRIQRTICPEGKVTLIVGFAIRPGAGAFNGTAFCSLFGTASQHVLLVGNADGTVSVCRAGNASVLSVTGVVTLATSTTTLQAGQWTHIQFRATLGESPDGAVSVRFNGATTDEIALTGIDTRLGTSDTLFTGVAFGPAHNGADDLDDVWVNDSTGDVCNGFLGDMRVDSHMPITDGVNHGWTPGGYQYLAETAPDTTATTGTNTLYLIPITVPANRSVSAALFRANGTHTFNAASVLYSDSGGAPNALLASSASTSVSTTPGADIRVPFVTPYTTGGSPETLWIGFVRNSTEGWYVTTTGTAGKYWANGSLTPPASAPAASSDTSRYFFQTEVSPDANARYATIDETTPNIADYNSTLTKDAKDTFLVEAFKNNGADIVAIQPTLLVAKSDAGSCAIQTVLREGGTDTPGSTLMYPGTTPQVMYENLSLAVGDAKRAAAGFNAVEYGYLKAV